MAYRTINERRADERQAALLWLFITTRGLLEDFTEFCRLHRAASLEDIDRELKKILKDNAD